MNIIKAQNLACPLDGHHLSSDERELSCQNGHTYDIARQGYVNLLLVQNKRSKNPGDSKEMVVARTEFLNTAVYEPIAKLLSELCIDQFSHHEKLCILDAGCGEGYYLDYVQHELESLDDEISVSLIGLDISKPAILASAKRNKNITWVVGTNRQLPMQTNSVDIILCVFGFENLAGFNKVLKSSGIIILVEPGNNHLNELKEIIYTDDKKSHNKNNNDLIGGDFLELDNRALGFKTGDLDNKQINNLLLMTPHLFRATKEGKEAASNLEKLDVSVDIVFRILQKK